MARMLRLCCCFRIGPREKKRPSTIAESFTTQETYGSSVSGKNEVQHFEESISPISPESASQPSYLTRISSRIRLSAQFVSFMMATEEEMIASLKGRIWGNMVHEKDHIHRFFPESGWEGLLQRNEVKATLKKCQKDPPPPNLVDFILNKASKIFAILIAMRQPESILTFYKNDFGQENLPVESGCVEQMLKGDGWESDSISDFCDKQWWFTSPTFTKDKFRYEFVKCCHLPFTTADKGRSLGASNYSTVEERSIHVDHIELLASQNPAKDKSGNPRVAVKTLLSLEQDPADREAKVLEMMRELETDHMIKAIAYYKYDDKHHFMFPWAEHGNLWEFWTKGLGPSLEKLYVIWMFKQLKGLADAIERLHNQKTCRHGDLKPENILCFSQDTSDGSSTPGVRMVITDVGLAKDHAERTRFRQATNTKVSTKRYSAPEMDVYPDAPLSRRFDIWSMGCILLEFVIWILYGGEELIQCTETLIIAFYKVKRDEGERVISVGIEPTVQGWISSIRKDWRCASGTALERLLNLITDKLLVVNVQDPIDSPVLIEPFEQSKPRTYARGMREGLEGIVTDLETGKINAVGERPSIDAPERQGPSHFASITQGGLLAPGRYRTRNVRVQQQYTSQVAGS